MEKQNNHAAGFRVKKVGGPRSRHDVPFEESSPGISQHHPDIPDPADSHLAWHSSISWWVNRSGVRRVASQKARRQRCSCSIRCPIHLGAPALSLHKKRRFAPGMAAHTQLRHRATHAGDDCCVREGERGGDEGGDGLVTITMC